MAMNEPQSWIVGPECNGQVASTRQECYIPPWGIIEVKVVDACFYVIWGCILCQNDKVVAVEMNGMGNWNDSFVWVIRHVLGGNDKINITFVVVFGYDCVLRVESLVLKIENCWVRKIKPADRIRVYSKI